jgi:ComF family protein
MIDDLLSYVAPHSCCGCGEVGVELCEGCKHNIIAEGFSACVVCMRPTSGDNLCGRCDEFPADVLWCVGWRHNELKSLLDRYKFEALRSAYQPLVDLLDAVIPPLNDGVVVTVVPTSASHSRERGFDHMTLVGRGFAKRRGHEFQSLLRRTGTGTQHFKTKNERLVAAQNSFERVSAKAPERVLLIDDIFTTGATLRANLDLLQGAGTTSLYGAIIARQPLDESVDLW